MEVYRKVDNLIEKLRTSKYIGIDGVDGAGKTFLAERIGGRLNIPVINLDNYLARNKKKYSANLNYKEISKKIKKHKKFVIEGVCFLTIIKRINISIDKFIYVKRMNKRGEWLDSEECDIRKFPEKRIRTIENRVRTLDPCYPGLSSYRKEVIYYHTNKRPFEKAQYIFERIKVQGL